MPRIHLAKLVGIAAWIGAVGLFAWIAAFWFWRMLEPRAAPNPIRENANWSATILSGAAMGFAAAEPPAMTPAATASGPDVSVRLMGIAREGTGASEDARALVKVDNKRVLWLKAGDELAAGTRVVAIDADAIRIVRDGRESRVLLREPRSSGRSATAAAGTPSVAGAPPAALAPAPAGTAKSSDTCKLAPEQRTRAYILRPEIVEGVIRERNGWTDLFKPAGAGLLVQNPGGTGAMLGLYGNDVLMKADGAQLGSLDDVIRLVLEPLARNDSVVVTGTRGGQAREWIYAGINCLAR